MLNILKKHIAIIALPFFAMNVANAEIFKCVDNQGNVTYSNSKNSCPGQGKKLDIPENYPKAVPYVPKYEQPALPQFSNTQNPMPQTAPISLPPLPPNTQLPPTDPMPASSPSNPPATSGGQTAPKQVSPAAPAIPEGQGGVFLKPPTETN